MMTVPLTQVVVGGRVRTPRRAERRAHSDTRALGA